MDTPVQRPTPADLAAGTEFEAYAAACHVHAHANGILGRIDADIQQHSPWLRAAWHAARLLARMRMTASQAAGEAVQPAQAQAWYLQTCQMTGAEPWSRAEHLLGFDLQQLFDDCGARR